MRKSQHCIVIKKLTWTGFEFLWPAYRADTPSSQLRRAQVQIVLSVRKILATYQDIVFNHATDCRNLGIRLYGLRVPSCKNLSESRTYTLFISVHLFSDTPVGKVLMFVRHVAAVWMKSVLDIFNHCLARSHKEDNSPQQSPFWFKFHEGYSNAVRRKVKIKSLLWRVYFAS